MLDMSRAFMLLAGVLLMLAASGLMSYLRPRPKLARGAPAEQVAE